MKEKTKIFFIKEIKGKEKNYFKVKEKLSKAYYIHVTEFDNFNPG